MLLTNLQDCEWQQRTMRHEGGGKYNAAPARRSMHTARCSRPSQPRHAGPGAARAPPAAAGAGPGAHVYVHVFRRHTPESRPGPARAVLVHRPTQCQGHAAPRSGRASSAGYALNKRYCCESEMMPLREATVAAAATNKMTTLTTHIRDLAWRVGRCTEQNSSVGNRMPAHAASMHTGLGPLPGLGR